MAESSTITREMIEAGARAYDRDTLRKAGWTEATIAEMMEDREPSPSSLEASELILRAVLAPCVAARLAPRADGCRSAFAPCAHQKDDPTTLCGSCQRAAADRDFDEDMMPGGFN